MARYWLFGKVISHIFCLWLVFPSMDTGNIKKAQCCRGCSTNYLTFLEKVHLPPPAPCHVSHVMCHMSCVTCHVSHVTWQVSHVTCQMSSLFLQSVEACQLRVCYQRGLPRLVSTNNSHHTMFCIATEPCGEPCVQS